METKFKISSEWIYKYYKFLEENKIENHGLLIKQGNETVFEEYAPPYSAEMPHTLFSVTKSIVSTAAGFAISEGLFALDTKIIDIFPEYEACRDERWSKLTIRSVLTMQSNKEFSFLQDMTGNYVEMFMKAPFRKKEGFLYSNNDAHIVAAAVQKLSGENLVDYLTPRLFEPLGIDTPFWETNDTGECIGGTGCYLKLRDLAKICRCYADGGKFNEKQIIPEFWTREATKIQVQFKENKGYGYLFWINNGVFSMTGMFGQLISYFPESDTVVATFNSCIDEGANSRALEEILPNAFNKESTEEWDSALKDYLESRKKKIPHCEKLPEIPCNKDFHITPLSNLSAKLIFPASLIPRSLTSSFAKRPKSNLDCVSFKTEENALIIKWKEENDLVTIRCGINGEPILSQCSIKGYPYKIWAYAYSENEKLKAVVKPLNTLSTQYISFDFKQNKIKMKFEGTPSFPEFILKKALEPDFIRNSKLLKAVVSKIMYAVLSTTEREMIFK